MTADHHITVYFGEETTPFRHYRGSPEAARWFAATIHHAGVGRVGIDDQVDDGMPRLPVEALVDIPRGRGDRACPPRDGP